MRAVQSALLLGTLGLVLAGGCVQPAPRQVRPALPIGFGAVMPDASIAGYVHLDQGPDPFILEHTFVSPDGQSLPVRAEVQTVSAWVGPIEDDALPALAARIVFWREADARTARRDMAQALTNADLWLKQDGTVLYLVLGDDAAATAFREALDKGKFVEMSPTRHRAWNTVLSLPVRPPKRVIGAGYMDVPAELLPLSFEALASQGGPDLRQVGGLVRQARIGHVAFGIYGDRFPVLTPQTTLSDLAASHLGAVAVADTVIPASLLSLSFNMAGRRLGLDQVRLRDGRAYVYGNQELVTLTRTYGESIYTAAAFSQEDARLLLEGLER